VHALPRAKARFRRTTREAANAAQARYPSKQQGATEELALPNVLEGRRRLSVSDLSSLRSEVQGVALQVHAKDCDRLLQPLRPELGRQEDFTDSPGTDLGSLSARRQEQRLDRGRLGCTRHRFSSWWSSRVVVQAEQERANRVPVARRAQWRASATAVVAGRGRCRLAVPSTALMGSSLAQGQCRLNSLAVASERLLGRTRGSSP